ncbi:type IV toxin-antitoxin system AbiEi family antitoxin domain-containing protein [Verrucosispora sp. WMMD1129]|uniref:type IV toxin-antitoxin system AbiEi family antitoxin domain-containing protein n=1 Tax=Verrucosispora sp. WMMD1129 TaxID=3016093 RepID=UPI00249C55F7|nr:type IV toxin-antitoxin system AbiEi family antitoxin domain-containing protein [Verrucosispora sp. WMMD1129]WFE45560.1 type IV toxin-antitoxin system AbiEi family antitoxin domain-containing protein [Verrucosispora sp. WMMD1129]
MEAFEVLTRVAAEQGGVVTATQALAAGYTRDQIRHLVRSGRWTRVARGRFLPDPALDVLRHRRARIGAAVDSLGPGAVAVLDTAVELHGVAGLRATSTIHVSVPPDSPRPQRRNDPDLVVHQLTLGSADVGVVAGIPVTSAVRTVADVILRVGRYPAVCVLDSALNRKLVSEADFAAIPALIAGRRGARVARQCLAEADGRAQSPLETRTRLRCVDGGVPPDVLQLEVRDDDGYLLGIGDLGWRRSRVIAEADGAAPHRTPQAVYEDRIRQNRLTNAGWRILRFTWPDTLRPDYIPETVRRALDR